MRLGTSRCVIVVPVYQDSFTKIESAALRVCSQRLCEFELAILHPRSVSVEAVHALVDPFLMPEQIKHYVPVSDSFLASVDAYNQMLLQPWFYRLFQAWEYLLIYQLDAWIFREDLTEWLDAGYTYIGAPWVRSLGEDTPDTGVGNGGLSLRHVQSFIHILESPRNWYWPVFRGRHLAWRICLFRRYRMLPRRSRPTYFCKRLALFLLMSLGWQNNLRYFSKINKLEDHFYSFFAPLVHTWMAIPGLEEASKFSIETNPRATFHQLAHQLPFGCHAWEKHDPDFWLMECPDEFSELY